jgi:hypothetical protein
VRLSLGFIAAPPRAGLRATGIRAGRCRRPRSRRSGDRRGRNVDGVGDVDLADAFAEAVVLVAGDAGGGGGLGEAALGVVGEVAGAIADQAAVGVPAVVLRRGAVDTLQAVAGRVEGVGAGRAAEGVAQTVAGGVPGVAVAGVGQVGAGQAVQAVVAVGGAAAACAASNWALRRPAASWLSSQCSLPRV